MAVVRYQAGSKKVTVDDPSADTDAVAKGWADSEYGGGGTFGTEFDHAHTAGEITTTSTSWQEAQTIDMSAETPAGTYRVGWCYTWRYGIAYRDFRGRVQVDDSTTLMEHREEPQDPGSDQRLVCGGFAYVTLTAEAHTIDLDYCSSFSGDTAGIRERYLEVWRVE